MSSPARRFRVSIRTLTSLVVGAGLCACVTTLAIGQTASSARPGPAASWPPDKSEYNVTMDEVLNAVRNRTNMTFGADGLTPPMTRYDARTQVTTKSPPTPYKGTGTQVEYFGADGKLYLWYPGSTIISHGKWSLSSKPMQRRDGTIVQAVTYCFTYDPVNPPPKTGPVV